MWIFGIEEYRSHAHSVSSCKYHFVWCPKYRHPILNVVEGDVRELSDETADHFGHEILALEIANDRVHLFVQTDPTQSGRHRSAVQVVLWQAPAGTASRDPGGVFLGWRILEGRILRMNDRSGVGRSG
jgi:hypothetical protein